MRNYATDPTTKELVDNLDIFILPSVNPDGGHNSLYDFSAQAAQHGQPLRADDTFQRRRRPQRVGRRPQPQQHDRHALRRLRRRVDTNCTSDTFAGPFEASEPEIRNEHWVVDTFSNIKFAINIHTHGGYFMWAPGAYKVRRAA